MVHVLLLYVIFWINITAALMCMLVLMFVGEFILITLYTVKSFDPQHRIIFCKINVCLCHPSTLEITYFLKTAFHKLRQTGTVFFKYIYL